MLTQGLRAAAALLLVLSLVAGCKTLPDAEGLGAARHAQKHSTDTEQLAKAYAHFATGALLRFQDDPEGALEHFAQAALLDPANEALVLEVAQQYAQREQPLKALQLLTNAVAAGTASAEVYTQLGSTYASLGKLDLAEKSYRRALALAPDSITATRNLFLLLLREKQPARAWRVLNRALEREPKKPEFQIELAELCLVYAQQYPRMATQARTAALTVLDQAAALNPVNPHTKLKIADGFARLDEPQRALALYTNLFEFYREFPGLRNSLRVKMAEQHLRIGNSAEAVTLLEAVAHEQPVDPAPRFWLGIIALQDNKPAQAAEYFNKAISVAPDFMQAYVELARAQLTANRPDAAIETLDKARTKFGEKFAIAYFAGLAYAQKKDYTNAIHHYKIAERLSKTTNPNATNAMLYFQLGAAYERTSQIELAAECFKTALAVAPDFHEALNYLGYMWAERGINLRQAHALIQRAVKLDPTNAAYLDSLGWVMFKQGKVRQALKHILRAAELSEKPDPVILDHLGDIYAALNQYEKAIGAWRKSLELEHNPDVEAKILRHHTKRP
ncbi:MAG: tetratricopeptide repeat protein [Verrucomicrobiales bacterium]|nr:tetratricopeptide repeat protein [Verrucomicrobiales bacterium]